MKASSTLEITIDTSLQQVMMALQNVEQLPQWSKGYDTAKAGQRDSSGRPLTVFVTTKLPTGHDWQKLRYTWSENKVNWEIADSSRKINGSGYFALTERGPRQTDVVYHVELSFRVPIPGILIKPAFIRANRKVLENFRIFAESWG